MVELFAALGFAEGPRLRSRSRSRLSPGRELPTPAELNGPHGPEPLGRDFHPLRPPRPWAIIKNRPRYFSVAPIPPRRGFARSDRTPGLLSRAGRHRPGTQNEDYSDEPPSNRTSTYPCIRLYGSTSRRMVNPAPFGRLVRPTYTGDAAHLEDASNAPRS